MSGKMTKALTDSEIAKRRFGPAHKRPCAKPGTITCALWECQKANRCKEAGRLQAEESGR